MGIISFAAGAVILLVSVFFYEVDGASPQFSALAFAGVFVMFFTLTRGTRHKAIQIED